MFETYEDEDLEEVLCTAAWESTSIQLVFILMAMQVIDGGETSRLIFSAFVTYWIFVFLLCLRPIDFLTSVDLFLIRFGFFIFYLTVYFVFPSLSYLLR